MLIGTPVLLHAQARPFTASLGIGSGATSFSCDACGSHHDAGVAWLASAGVRVHPALVVAAEASGWSGNYADSRGTGNARIVFGDVDVAWHPRPTSGFFVKAGAGAAWITDDVTITQVGKTTVTSHSPAFIVGAGWDMPVARGFAITPYANLDYAAQSNGTVNGFRGAQKLGGTLAHVGIAATLR
jgi:hypothetical protein